MVHNADPLPEDASRTAKLIRRLRGAKHRRELSKKADERAKSRQFERAREGKPQDSARAELSALAEDFGLDTAAEVIENPTKAASARAKQQIDRSEAEIAGEFGSKDVTEIPGIGDKTAADLKFQGIETAAELREAAQRNPSALPEQAKRALPQTLTKQPEQRSGGAGGFVTSLTGGQQKTQRDRERAGDVGIDLGIGTGGDDGDSKESMDDFLY